MCLRMTAPFLVSTSPLSLLWRGRGFVLCVGDPGVSRWRGALLCSRRASGWADTAGEVGDGRRSGPGLDIAQTALAVARLPPQVIQVGHGNRGEARILRLAVELVLAFQNAPRGGPAQVLVRFIDQGQQFHVGPRIALGKAMPPIGRNFDPPATPVARD